MKAVRMDFIEAVNEASRGRKIQRAEWSDKEYAYFNDGELYFASTDGLYNEPMKMLHEFLVADDWRIFHEQSITFMEALKHVKAGKEVRRRGWKEGKYVRATVPDKRGIGLFVDMGIAKSSPLTIEDFEADDWIVD